MTRCSFNHNGKGPQCCVESTDGTHDGPHRFKCAGAGCPGLIWPASVMAHPITCTTLASVLLAAGCHVIHAELQRVIRAEAFDAETVKREVPDLDEHERRTATLTAVRG